MTSRIPPIVAAIALVVAACSPDSAQPVDETAARERPRETVAPGLAAPQPRQTLAAADIDGAGLAGELSCAFAESAAAGPLLVATADVADEARADGVLQLGPSTLHLKAATAGGFNAMVNGARFTSGDLAARVVVISGTPLAGGESPPLPARLEIDSGAGTLRIAGQWTCGP